MLLVHAPHHPFTPAHMLKVAQYRATSFVSILMPIE
jgi:hypothetical protein